mmetsp:Transcript_33149/g.53260  ORF Transcript_33149/g.53260 Transcript_33149/m.53260 type:complete len:90 (-) Transcript_33149:52-321(-)
MQWQMMLQSQMQMVMQLLQSKQSQMPQAPQAPQAEGPGQFNDLVNAFQHRAGAPAPGHACPPAPQAQQAPCAAPQAAPAPESGNPFDMF